MSSDTERETVIADLKRHMFVFVLYEHADPAVARRMTDAYDQLKSLEISVTWHHATEPLPIQDTNNPTVFVMEPFDTPFFQEIKHDFRIIYPMCLLTCINLTVKIPISSCRCLANIALRNCIVSSSCFTREEIVVIEQRVKLMGGIYSGTLKNNATHLITEEVHSQKYSSAYMSRIPVVLRSWLDEAWRLSRSNPNFVALNRAFTKLHSCPVFRKCNVVVTTFTGDDRDEMIRLLKTNGANYSADIIVEGEYQTTHLVAKRPGSQKYISAAQTCLMIVTKDWVTDCIEKGYRLPENEYQFSAKTAARRAGGSESETLSETLNQLELEGEPCQPILDGCMVYLCGFSDSQLQRVKKILNMCKATRLSKLTADVTHAVLGCPTQRQRSQVSSLSPPPSYVVRYQWLVDCWKQRAAVSESDYLIDLTNRTGREESSRAKSSGLRQRRDTQSTPDSDLTSQYIKKEKILSNYNFLLIDPVPSMVDETKKLILKNGGNLITSDSENVANYTIVPVDYLPQLDRTTLLVTLYWLESSLFAKKLLPQNMHPLFAPAQDFGCKDVLSSLAVSLLWVRDRYVIWVSVTQLLHYMGAINASQLKRTGPDRTDLVITDDPNQEAVRQANEWNIPVVTLDWVFQCAINKDKLPFNLYLLSPSSQPTIDSPSRLLSSDRSKILVLGPAFELEDAETFFPHGATPHVKNPTKSRSVNSQLTEMYTNNLESLTIRDFASEFNYPVSTSTHKNIYKESISGILQETTIAFANGFTPQELTQMTNIVSELGGTIDHSYNSRVTHYIYAGKHKSWSKGALLAKEDNKYVVHPQWLTDAKKFGRLPDTINYPPFSDPNNSIGYFKIEKFPEPERRSLAEPMDIRQSPVIPPDDSTDDKSRLVIGIGDVTQVSPPSHESAQEQLPVGHARKKRMRTTSVSTKRGEIQDVPEVTNQPSEPTSPRFRDNLSTQEVDDNFEFQCLKLKEADLSPLVPPSFQGSWENTGSNNEFKAPRESRRFSNLYHQKKSIIQNYPIIRETRERVVWDPLPHYLDNSPPSDT